MTYAEIVKELILAFGGPIKGETEDSPYPVTCVVQFDDGSRLHIDTLCDYPYQLWST